MSTPQGGQWRRQQRHPLPPLRRPALKGALSPVVLLLSVVITVLLRAWARLRAVLTRAAHPADFLDPMHHEAATGRPSVNLDTWMLTRQQVVDAFRRHTAGADVAVVEGVMGLFDGRDGATEAGSTAQLAKWLGAPVVLVLDASAVARSAAAVAKGYIEFDPDLRLGGLVFNKVGGAAHTQWLRDAMASAGIEPTVLGGVPKVGLGWGWRGP